MRRAISHNQLQRQNYGIGYCSFSDNKKYYSRKVYDIIAKSGKTYHRLLDVGCGDGEFASVIKRDFKAEAHGIDISTALADARKKGIIAVRHDVGKRFPYRDNTFDLVILIEVIEHVYDTDFLLSEINRIMAKGGLFILTTPNLASLENRFRLLFGLYPSLLPEYRATGPGHIRSYTIPVMKRQLKEHNFRVLRAVSANFPFPMESKVMPDTLKRVAMSLGDLFPEFGSHMVLVSTK